MLTEHVNFFTKLALMEVFYAYDHIRRCGKQKDLTINLRHMMSFGKDTEFEIKIKNGGEIVHSMKELIPIASRYLNEMKQE